MSGRDGEPAARAEERARRLALNEALARDVNERVDGVAARWFEPGEIVEFRCECSLAACDARVAVTREEYGNVRTSAFTFVVSPGHELPGIEEIVAYIREYPVVRKLGHGADVAEATDPRPKG